MNRLTLKGLVKVYPFVRPGWTIFGRRRAKAMLERQKSQPYVTDEGVLAVQDFNLEIKAGELVVLLGPSGCGKSTVLRMIAGLESVSAGDILMDGRSILDTPPHERDMAMVFQNYALYPNYTVYENLAFPLKSRHLPREQLDIQVRAAAEQLELLEVLDRYPRELSGGQRQRIAIGRALVRRPELFLMDEPFSNLDPILRRKLRKEVKLLHRRLGATFIYVTHDQAEAFALGDRIVVMENGMIRQTGTPGELYNRPGNLYTAAFVGTPPINLFRRVRLIRSCGGWTVSLFGREFSLPEKSCGELAERDNGREVILGLRPVHVALAEEGIPAVIEHTDIVEGELHIQMRLRQGEKILSVIPASGFSKYPKEGRVHLSLNPGRFHLFDPDTEQRIL